MKSKKRRRSLATLIATVVLFIVVFAVLVFGTSSLSGSADTESLAATKKAIERATILCYATEGFYPPGLSYLEENYGLQIDTSRFVVRYEALGSNVMPTIEVTTWQ